MTIQEMKANGINPKDVGEVADLYVYLAGGEPEFTDLDQDSPNSAFVEFLYFDFYGTEKYDDFILVKDKDDNWNKKEAN